MVINLIIGIRIQNAFKKREGFVLKKSIFTEDDRPIDKINMNDKWRKEFQCFSRM